MVGQGVEIGAISHLLMDVTNFMIEHLNQEVLGNLLTILNEEKEIGFVKTTELNDRLEIGLRTSLGKLKLHGLEF